MAYTAPGSCPVCQHPLTITRLHCRNCDSALEGRFDLGGFNRLSREQLQFAQAFLRNEGKLNRLQEELDLSYPTLRARLLDVIRAMGYAIRQESPEDRRALLVALTAGRATAAEVISGLSQPLTEEERRVVLEAVGQGHLKAAEAAKLIKGA